MHHRQPSHEGNTDLDERRPRAAGDGEDQGDEQDKADLKEDRNAHNEPDDHERPVHPALAEPADQRRRDARGAARFGHHLAQHRPQSHDDRDGAQRGSHAVLKRLHEAARGHARRGAEAE